MVEPEPLQILLAEDDDGHAYLVTKNLRRGGIANDVVRVSDGQQAVDYIWRQGVHANRPVGRPLLLMLDIRMPNMDGTEVLRRVKADPRLRRIPVIMLTTTDDPREVQHCYELGCNAYIVKPVEYDRFVDVIRDLGLFLSVVHIPPDMWNGE